MDKKDLKIALLENIDDVAVEIFHSNGFKNVFKTKESIDSLMENKKLIEANFVGIRSRSNLKKEVIRKLKNLIGIGCFCIGTDQVDLKFAKQSGIPVFNAPFSNTRSVAELVIGEIIMLYRNVIVKNKLTHQGIWDKNANGCYEVRGKTVGIIGYGNIGKQVGVLAEAIGMQVIYYDIEDKLSIGSSGKCKSLDEVLSFSDVVTLHVPDTNLTKNMINKETLSKMKKGAILINAARGGVVNVEDLCEFLKKEHISGAAIDVFPSEPKDNKEEFISPLREFENVILTPHIGGSTKEAQSNIAIEVSSKLVKYFNEGDTNMSVNYPNIMPERLSVKTRILHTHLNTPGMLEKINFVMSSNKINIVSQILKTDENIGYVILDVDSEINENVIDQVKNIPNTIKVRKIFL